MTNTLAYFIGDEERFCCSSIFALSNNHGYMLDLIMHCIRLECMPLPLNSNVVLYLWSLLFEGGHVMGSTQVGFSLACKF
jgi:hypothetical protein